MKICQYAFNAKAANREREDRQRQRQPTGLSNLFISPDDYLAVVFRPVRAMKITMKRVLQLRGKRNDVDSIHLHIIEDDPFAHIERLNHLGYIYAFVSFHIANIINIVSYYFLSEKILTKKSDFTAALELI
jgi:hypothetical protein